VRLIWSKFYGVLLSGQCEVLIANFDSHFKGSLLQKVLPSEENVLLEQNFIENRMNNMPKLSDYNAVQLIAV